MSLDTELKQEVDAKYRGTTIQNANFNGQESELDLSSAGKLAVQVGLERYAKMEELNRKLMDQVDQLKAEAKLQQLEIDHLRIRVHDMDKLAQQCTTEMQAANLQRTAVEAKMQMMVGTLRHLYAEANTVLNGKE